MRYRCMTSITVKIHSNNNTRLLNGFNLHESPKFKLVQWNVYFTGLRMKNKILLSNRGDVGDHYEPSDSENEYTEREKKLLQKVRKGKHRNEDPQEIMAFEQNDDDSEEGL